ncbi:hypothetical protein QAD02_008748 [Eretmocerus hayati]|uniref:Uncharacterized protein n=1 Tax=Eretmocerus hayati TaxID=131215 RepID=A0ACC2N7P6_9HYME|nr:hypothetical protein QAD02_008748 [Eretmocerus hayati]
MSNTNRINASACTFVLIFIVLIVYIGSEENVKIDLSFPDDFLIGAASSSYQVEGAWNISGRSESSWDYFSRKFPNKIADRSTGDIASNSYYKYKEDIQLMKDIGINHYRFSISWSRILPSGYPDSINKEGILYYHRILDELENQNIEPFVTLYHWDHPQSLEKLGGWMNDLMIDFFADYARIIYQEFGSRVKFFSTINEPYIYCKMGYELTSFAPGLNLSGWGPYVCVHNMLKAHAVAYHIYKNEFKSILNGQIGIVIPCFHYYSKNPKDTESNEIAFDFQCGWTANPIFSKTGDYPERMKKIIEKRSKLEGRKKSKLPVLSEKWIQYIRGSSDYFGLNHYTSYLAEPSIPSEVTNDEGLTYSSDPKWDTSQSDWLKIVPQGFGDLLRKIKHKYNNPPVFVLENGVSDANVVNDSTRIWYLYSYMKEMLIAMKRDHCDIRAYTIWSFLDSFEWSAGYVDKFGLVHVNFSDPNRTRTPKQSVSWLKSVLESRRLP